MKQELREITLCLQSDLKEFNNYFKSVLVSEKKLLDVILKYILRNKGKQIRPILVLFSAKLTNDKISEKTFVAASLIELLHTATLVHDDVVDNSQFRRGVFSIKALWKSKIAVLVGDFLLSKGLLLSVKYKTYDILEIVSDAVKEMAEGELLQIEKSKKLDITEDEYFSIIKKKTASLITASVMSGFVSSNQDERKLHIIKDFGEKLGIAFQLKDDLMDYKSFSVIGKSGGNDIQESKMTLPLIFALRNVGNKRKKEILRILKKREKSLKEIKKVQDFVKINGGLEYTDKILFGYINEAKRILEINFEKSECLESFKSLVDYMYIREK